MDSKVKQIVKEIQISNLLAKWPDAIVTFRDKNRIAIDFSKCYPKDHPGVKAMEADSGRQS